MPRDLRRRLAALEAQQQRGPGVWGTIVVTDDGDLVGLTTFSMDDREDLSPLRAWARSPGRGLVFLWVWTLGRVGNVDIIPASEISPEALALLTPYRTPGTVYHQV